MILVSPTSNPKLRISPRGFLTISDEPVSPSGVTWGIASVEPEEVPDSRLMIGHSFSPKDIAFAQAAGFTVSEDLPPDWRHPNESASI